MKSLLKFVLVLVPAISAICFGPTLKTSATPLIETAITPDQTLGAEQSRLIDTLDRIRVEGGAERGSALFHSFLDFNVGEGQRIYFVGSDGIANILTRVTGTQASNILGTLGVEGSANLFLMNPNGVLFGENAQLDLSGSFAATTAEQLWIEGTEFSAVRPKALPLLSVSLSPGLQYGASRPNSVVENQASLSIREQQSLTLQGGTVRQLGEILSPGGYVDLSGDMIELAGVVDTRSHNGQTGILLIDPKNIVIRDGEPLSGDDVSFALLTNNVTLQADNDITIADDIATATENDLTFSTGRSLTIGPNQSILLNGGDFAARINDQPVNPGDRDPGTAQFSMGSGAQILTNGGRTSITSGTFGETSGIDAANAAIVTGSRTTSGGAITLSALDNISAGLLDSRSEVGAGGNITLTSATGTIATNDNLLADGAGQGGNIELGTEGAIAIDGRLSTETFGQAGDITVSAGGDLEIRSPGPVVSMPADISSQGMLSGRISFASGGALTAEDIRLTSRIVGDGTGGDVTFSADSITFNQTSVALRTRDESQAFLGFEQDAITGNLTLESATDIVMQNSNAFVASDYGSADAGNVEVTTGRLHILNNSDFVFPFSSAFGIFAYGDDSSTGDGGNVTITATESVEIVGKSPGEFIRSESPAAAEAVFTELVTEGTSIFTTAFGGGKAGDISLNTGQLTIRDGAGLLTSAVFDEGGNLSVVADDINLQGFALLSTGTGAVGGNSGALTVEANNIRLTDGAVISTASFGPADSGELSVTARQLSVEGGSTVGASAFASGDGGRLSIQADELVEVFGTISDGSVFSAISSDSSGAGSAGPLSIDTDRLIVSDRGAIVTATTDSGAGADIDIDAGTLRLSAAQINASTATAEDGGNIHIRASDSIEVSGSGFDSLSQKIIEPAINGTLEIEDFDEGILTVTGGDGNAGSVLIETSQFAARNGALITTSTLDGGSGGDIDITATDDLQLESTLLSTATFAQAAAGDIRLNTSRLRASGGAQAITTTFGPGKAGNLTVTASESVDLIDPTATGIASGLLASSFETAAGTGGDILVNTRELRIIDGATVSVSGEGEGDAGNIDVSARSLLLDRGSITATSASGEGGSILLRIEDTAVLRNGSTISTTAGQVGSTGNGGNIIFSDGFILAVPAENSDISANAFEGRGGNIAITSRGLFGIEFRDRLTSNSDITASSDVGIDGEVDIKLINPPLEPTQVELPEQPTATDQVVVRCTAPENESNTLVVTGRGGLPTDPRQLIQGETVLEDLRFSNAVGLDRPITDSVSEPDLVEAQSWRFDELGRVQLTAARSLETALHTASQCSTLGEQAS
ncbi:filamentous haemagglutinin family N-terminal domain protein [Synechococcus sp. PCC 7335]|uniref:two-partner secretion domain-containing protein n=1 Tax=Synechococcus sp. (strain ATCC 29403 / PCC 7335) TaxID=91464 RepID=UPI00017ECF15|nr:filamentous hemagglutinin N-terminal domain-containing protein [Synechococcus sp. PCC 7335]EDX83095.1 filamentous haemagglutinin family N-terminal domain protein [Synechococcus sp. PCC 7335]